jgi:excisionase family DNA binding protein
MAVDGASSRASPEPIPSLPDGDALQGPLVVSVTEAARILGISRAHAYELARIGELPVIRLGRRRLVPVTGIEALLRQALGRFAVDRAPPDTSLS